MPAGEGNLAGLHCTACRPGSPPASPEELETFLEEYPVWLVKVEADGVPQLERVYKFKNYRQALDFSNQVAALAEAEDHHPAILLEWGQVTVRWWTHVLRGLHRNDLIMAAKTEALYNRP
jgi:4a-hydroxytetrahydrobiopterin dehydratase